MAKRFPINFEPFLSIRLIIITLLTCLLALPLTVTVFAEGGIAYGQYVEDKLDADDGDDNDTWTFYGRTGDDVDISVKDIKGDWSLDTYVELFAPNGTLLAFDDDGAQSGRGYDSQLRYCCLQQDGQYSIVVSYARGSRNNWGSYSLTLNGGRVKVSQPQDCVRSPRLQRGGNAQNISNSNNSMRSGPSLGNPRVGVIGAGEVAKVLDGPVLGDGFYWWQVHISGLTGWTAESGDCEYWMAPTNLAPRDTCALNPQLQVGGRAQNINGAPSRMRRGPTLTEPRVAAIEPDQVVDVLGGPVSADGYRWWQVRDGNVVGWTAESGNCEYWLAPFHVSANMRYGETGSSQLNDVDFFDDFKFDAREGDRITITMDGTSGDLDPAIRLYASSGQELAYDDNSGPGNNAMIGDFRIPEDAEYTIHALRNRAGQSGTYELSLTLSEAPVEQAQPVVCGQTVTGELTDDDPRDFWHFEGIPDQTVTISMWADELESALVLSDGSGFVLGRSSGIGNAYLELTLTESTSYTVEATRRAGESGTSGGSYSLLLDCDIVYVPPLDPDLVSVSPGRPISGCLKEGDEYQELQLRLTEPENIISLRMAAPGQDLIPGLTLFDNVGNELATDENAIDAEIAQLPNVNLGPGLYFVSAWSVSGGGCYTMEVMDYWLPPVEMGALPITAEDLIDNHGFQITALYGLDSGVLFTRYSPSACVYGNQDICDPAPLDIVDISGAVGQGIALCFPQEGIIVFMPATGEDVTTLPYETTEGRTCTRLDEAGRIALLSLDSEERFIQRHAWQANALDRVLVRPAAFVIDLKVTAGILKGAKALKVLNPKYLKYLKGLEIALTIGGLGKVFGIADGTVFETIPTGPADYVVIKHHESLGDQYCLLKPHQGGVYLREEPSLTAGTLGTLDTPHYSMPSYLRIDDDDNWWWGLLLFKQGTASIFRPDDAEVALGWVRAESVELSSRCTEDLFADSVTYDESAPDQQLSSDFSNLRRLENCEATVHEGYDPQHLRRSPGGSLLLDEDDELLVVPEGTLLRAVEVTDEWVKVKFNGIAGWAHSKFSAVAPTDETEANCWDDTFF